MKKLMLALTLVTLGTASLCAMENAAIAKTNPESTVTADTTSTDALATALEANISASNADVTTKTNAITWVKNHKFLVSMIVAIVCGATVGYIYRDTIAPATKSGLNASFSYVANKATGAWTVCKDNKRISIPVATAAVLIAAIGADLLRGENSWIRKTFSKKQAA